MSKTVLIWGAGKIGRGYVAHVFRQGGYRIIFVVRSQQRVDELRRAGQYTVAQGEAGAAPKNVVIDNYEAFATTETEEVARAMVATDVVCVPIYPRDFSAVAQQLVPGLLRRRHERPEAALDILLCVNLIGAADEFRTALRAALPADASDYLESRIGTAQVLVMCGVVEPPDQVHARDPLLLYSSGEDAFPVDARALKGQPPAIPGLRLVTNIDAENARKLFSGNMGHAALAYLGAERGYVWLQDAIANPQIRDEVKGALDEVSQALIAEYDLPAGEMQEWTADLKRGLLAPTPGDTVARVAADPVRKLGRHDRLIGPAVLAFRHGIEAPHLTRIVVSALHYLRAAQAGPASALSVEQSLRQVCGLTDAEAGLMQAILRTYAAAFPE